MKSTLITIRPLPEGGGLSSFVSFWFLFLFSLRLNFSFRQFYQSFWFLFLFSLRPFFCLICLVCSFMFVTSTGYWSKPLPDKLSAEDRSFERALLYTKGGADPTFASAKVKNAIGRIGIFLIGFNCTY